jgi:hypothetical protein
MAIYGSIEGFNQHTKFTSPTDFCPQLHNNVDTIVHKPDNGPVYSVLLWNNFDADETLSNIEFWNSIVSTNLASTETTLHGDDAALVENMKQKVPVRVIRKYNDKLYRYEGVFMVKSRWTETVTKPNLPTTVVESSEQIKVYTTTNTSFDTTKDFIMSSRYKIDSEQIEFVFPACDRDSVDRVIDVKYDSRNNVIDFTVLGSVSHKYCRCDNMETSLALVDQLKEMLQATIQAQTKWYLRCTYSLQGPITLFLNERKTEESTVTIYKADSVELLFSKIACVEKEKPEQVERVTSVSYDTKDNLVDLLVTSQGIGSHRFFSCKDEETNRAMVQQIQKMLEHAKRKNVIWNARYTYEYDWHLSNKNLIHNWDPRSYMY